jgi:hypothetical protein
VSQTAVAFEASLSFVCNSLWHSNSFWPYADNFSAICTVISACKFSYSMSFSFCDVERVVSRHYFFQSKQVMIKKFLAINSWLIHRFSFEWLLNSRANGGDVIFLRAFLVSSFLFLVSIAITQCLESGRTFDYSSQEFKSAVTKNFTWFGAIFGAVYFALYARFASQWGYLANLYNQIKAAEVKDLSVDRLLVMAQWKAGFIEDSEDLHLSTKGVFAGIIRTWLEDKDVKESFIKHAPGGQGRLDNLLKRVSLSGESMK